MASAMVVPFLSERMARPVRESSRLVTAMAAPSATIQISTYMARPLARLRLPMLSAGTPSRPSYLPRNSMLAMV